MHCGKPYEPDFKPGDGTTQRPECLGEVLLIGLARPGKNAECHPSPISRPSASGFGMTFVKDDTSAISVVGENPEVALGAMSTTYKENNPYIIL